MTDTKHTPTPWKHVGCYVLDGDGKRVLEVCGNYNYFTDTGNAASIVKCVNMHDELVEALIRMKQWCEDEVGAELPCSSIDAALKKAGAL